MANLDIAKVLLRLEKIGITLQLAANYPWIYVTKINGILVTETFQANHGFTAFILQHDGIMKFADRRELFKLIRRMM